MTLHMGNPRAGTHQRLAIEGNPTVSGFTAIPPVLGFREDPLQIP